VCGIGGVHGAWQRHGGGLAGATLFQTKNRLFEASKMGVLYLSCTFELQVTEIQAVKQFKDDCLAIPDAASGRDIAPSTFEGS